MTEKKQQINLEENMASIIISTDAADDFINIEPWTKSPSLSRRHFQTHFLE